MEQKLKELQHNEVERDPKVDEISMQLSLSLGNFYKALAANIDDKIPLDQLKELGQQLVCSSTYLIGGLGGVL